MSAARDSGRSPVTPSGVRGDAGSGADRQAPPPAPSAAWVRWFNGVRYRALLAILGRTHVGRAVLFVQWANGFKVGRGRG